MSAERIVAGKYARSLYEVADAAGEAGAVREDLAWLSLALGQGEGRDLMAHPLLPAQEKKRVLADVLHGRVRGVTLMLLERLADKGRGGLVGLVAEAYDAEWNRRHRRERATVCSAAPLTAEQRRLLQERLSALRGGEVDLEECVIPSLRAGVRVEVGDLLLDGTLAGRLQRLRRVLIDHP